MFSNQSTEVSLNGPCRALCAIRGDTVENRFVAGTCFVNNNNNNNNTNSSNRSSSINRRRTNSNDANVDNIEGSGNVNNRMFVLRYHSDSNELLIESEFDHFTGAVDSVCCHPSDASLIITTTMTKSMTPSESDGSVCVATLWKLPPSPENVVSFRLDDEDEDVSPGKAYYYGRRDGYDDNDRNRDPSNDDNYSGRGQMESDAMMDRIATLQFHPGDDSGVGVTGSSSSSRLAATTDVAWKDFGCTNESPSSPSPATGGEVATVDAAGNVTQWDVSFGAADPVRRVSVSHCDSFSSVTALPRLEWDPHSGDTVAVAYGTSVSILDWRAGIGSGLYMTSTSSAPATAGITVDALRNCHRYGVTDLHFNPNKPYVIVTSGKDGLLKFWDLRATGRGHVSQQQQLSHRPLVAARGGHSHWISSVQYNPFHDQLVLSTGTDSVVNLWRFSTISSAPLFAYDADDANHNSNDNHSHVDMSFGGGQPQQQTTGEVSLQLSSSAPNARIVRHDQHAGEGSEGGGGVFDCPVYAASWGAADAWIYVTVGYSDGKAILNHVPSREKYKILL